MVNDFIRAEHNVFCLCRVHAEVHGALLVVEGEGPEVKGAAVLHVHLVRHHQGVVNAKIDFV